MTDQYGPNLITNGDFDSNSGWTLGGNWQYFSAAKLAFCGPSGVGVLSKSFVFESGWTYRVQATVTLANGATAAVKVGGGATVPLTGGANTVEVAAGSSNALLEITAIASGGTQVVLVDDVAVALVIPDGAAVTNDPAVIIVKFAVPLGHQPGDYAMLYSNNGSGAIDWDTPYSTKRIDLFPNGAGNYGFGYAPFGYGPFGLPYGKNLTRGFGTTPFGYSPFGFGAVLIKETIPVTDCGDWIFGVTCFDALGNENTGTPNQVTAAVHVAPPKPAGLQKDSYDPDTDILTLTVATPDTAFPMGVPPSRLWPALTGGPYESDPPSRIDPPSGSTDDGAVDPGLPARV